MTENKQMEDDTIRNDNMDRYRKVSGLGVVRG